MGIRSSVILELAGVNSKEFAARKDAVALSLSSLSHDRGERFGLQTAKTERYKKTTGMRAHSFGVCSCITCCQIGDLQPQNIVQTRYQVSKL